MRVKEYKREKARVKKFIEEQLGLRHPATNRRLVKKRDIALSLYAKGYSSAQVALILNVKTATAHAFKVDFTKEGKVQHDEGLKTKRVEIKNYLKANTDKMRLFYRDVKTLVGPAIHTPSGQKMLRKRMQRVATA